MGYDEQNPNHGRRYGALRGQILTVGQIGTGYLKLVPQIVLKYTQNETNVLSKQKKIIGSAPKLQWERVDCSPNPHIDFVYMSKLHKGQGSLGRLLMYPALSYGKSGVYQGSGSHHRPLLKHKRIT
jgi:hypothetical protein